MKRIIWTLVDDSNPYYNIWSCTAGFRECFYKNVDPNDLVRRKESRVMTDDMEDFYD